MEHHIDIDKLIYFRIFPVLIVLAIVINSFLVHLLFRTPWYRRNVVYNLPRIMVATNLALSLIYLPMIYEMYRKHYNPFDTSLTLIRARVSAMLIYNIFKDSFKKLLVMTTVEYFFEKYMCTVKPFTLRRLRSSRMYRMMPYITFIIIFLVYSTNIFLRLYSITPVNMDLFIRDMNNNTICPSPRRTDVAAPWRAHKIYQEFFPKLIGSNTSMPGGNYTDCRYYTFTAVYSAHAKIYCYWREVILFIVPWLCLIVISALFLGSVYRLKSTVLPYVTGPTENKPNNNVQQTSTPHRAILLLNQTFFMQDVSTRFRHSMLNNEIRRRNHKKAVMLAWLNAGVSFVSLTLVSPFAIAKLRYYTAERCPYYWNVLHSYTPYILLAESLNYSLVPMAYAIVDSNLCKTIKERICYPFSKIWRYWFRHQSFMGVL